MAPPVVENIVPGPYSQNFEKYVEVLFRPATTPRLITKALNDFTEEALPQNYKGEISDIPASIQLQVQADTSLEKMFSLYTKMDVDETKHISKFPVYQTKQSSEYHALLNRNRHGKDKDANDAYQTWSTPRPSTTEEKMFRLSPDSRQTLMPHQPRGEASKMLIDFADFDVRRQPRSEYMYPGYNYVRSNDSRIMGSNFMMLSLRGPDNWFNKVNKLLEEARNC